MRRGSGKFSFALSRQVVAWCPLRVFVCLSIKLQALREQVSLGAAERALAEGTRQMQQLVRELLAAVGGVSQSHIEELVQRGAGRPIIEAFTTGASIRATQDPLEAVDSSVTKIERTV